jgi:hypothetical protein
MLLEEIVGIFMQPPIRFPFAKKVTLPEVVTVAIKFVATRYVNDEGVARVVVVSEMATLTKVMTTLPGAT